MYIYVSIYQCTYVPMLNVHILCMYERACACIHTRARRERGREREKERERKREREKERKRERERSWTSSSEEDSSSASSCRLSLRFNLWALDNQATNIPPPYGNERKKRVARERRERRGGKERARCETRGVKRGESRGRERERKKETYSVNSSNQTVIIQHVSLFSNIRANLSLYQCAILS